MNGGSQAHAQTIGKNCPFRAERSSHAACKTGPIFVEFWQRLAPPACRRSRSRVFTTCCRAAQVAATLLPPCGRRLATQSAQRPIICLRACLPWACLLPLRSAAVAQPKAAARKRARSGVLWSFPCARCRRRKIIQKAASSKCVFLSFPLPPPARGKNLTLQAASSKRVLSPAA